MNMARVKRPKRIASKKSSAISRKLPESTCEPPRKRPAAASAGVVRGELFLIGIGVCAAHQFGR